MSRTATLLTMALAATAAIPFPAQAVSNTPTKSDAQATAQYAQISHGLWVGAPYRTDIMRLQSRLGLSADGLYGPQTHDAVRRWQSAHGLQVTGRVDVPTARSMGLWSGGASFPAYAAPDTGVMPSSSQQVMVARWVSGHTGTWGRYQWAGSTGWVKVNTSTSVAFGYNGTSTAAERREGDGTTPLGNYRMVYNFGTNNADTKMAHRTITGCSWWIGDASQGDYNRWRQSCSVPSATARKSEHLKSFTSAVNGIGQYDRASVIGFNYANPDRVSGSGIFLHYTPKGGKTAGCVGLSNRTELDRVLRWMDPQKNPRIVIRL